LDNTCVEGRTQGGCTGCTCIPPPLPSLKVSIPSKDPHCFDADQELDPDPAQNLDANPDPDPDPGGGGGVGQPKMCNPPGKILGTPLPVSTPSLFSLVNTFNVALASQSFTINY
jgi:hypothetical protein